MKKQKPKKQLKKKFLPQAVPELGGLPSGYSQFLSDIKNRVATAQTQAAISLTAVPR
jgi:hypothetical protein